jgi:hypothetical protein
LQFSYGKIISTLFTLIALFVVILPVFGERFTLTTWT